MEDIPNIIERNAVFDMVEDECPPTPPEVDHAAAAEEYVAHLESQVEKFKRMASERGRRELDLLRKVGVPILTEGTKHDSGKPPVSLVPQALVYGAARAYAFGAKKYAPHNYRLGIKTSRLLDAAMRHLLEKAEGVTADPESGLDPLDHAAAALGMLVDTLQRVKAGKLSAEFDDLYKEPAK